MQKSDSITVLLTHLGLLLFGQIISIFLVQFTMQFIVLQDRLPTEELQGKSFEELSEIQKVAAADFEKDLRERPDEIQNRYIEIVLTERNGVLFWSSLLWAFSFIVPAWFLLGKKMNIPISKLEDPFLKESLGRGVIAGLGIFFVVSIVGLFLQLIDMKPENNEFQKMLFTKLKSNATLLAWSVYSVGLVTGIIEEWFFRGILLKHFLSKGLIREGWIITSVLFGALHYSPEASLLIPVILTGVGLAFGYLYLRSGNIWAPITAHATYNSVGLVVAYFVGDAVT